VRHDAIEGVSLRASHDVFEHEHDPRWRAALLTEGARVAWYTNQDDLAKRRAEALLDLTLACNWSMDTPALRRHLRQALELAEATAGTGDTIELDCDCGHDECGGNF